jgi:1,2-dihydroxy-3-keto-5-methylthiopentene dioxygenase
MLALTKFLDINMAIIRLTDGTLYHDRADVDRELAPLNIHLQQWPLGNNPQLLSILNQPQLSEEDKSIVLSHLDRYFEQLQASGYLSQDVIDIYPTLTGVDEMLAGFDRCHTHTYDEVRYIIVGEGIVGFVRPDKSQIELTIKAGERIIIPAGTEHWFYLNNRRFVTVRYYINLEGLIPQYVDTPILFRTALATK